MRRPAPPTLARLASFVMAVVLVCSAVAPALAAAPVAAGSTSADTGSAVTSAQQTAPSDPDSDVIGWEDGYWHNESIDVDQSDGLTDAELDAYVARAMARVEYVRQAEFDKTVPVSVISREEYRNRSSGGGDANRTEFNRWNDQVWEGLFIVGESTGSGEALSQTTGSSVLGFYSPTRDEITIVTDSPDSPTISNATLVHELVHALQDQQYDLTNATYRGTTQDGDLAVDGVVEGEANYIEARYAERCGAEWDCVETPSSSSSGSSGPGPNLGVLLTLLNPYSDGPVYVADIVEEGGWEAFDEAFRNPPTSSEQVIHLTDDEPTPIEFTDTGENGWSTFPRDNPQLGQNGSDTVGEASIYAMFWYQAREYGADTINPNSLFQTDAEYDTYNYDAEPSEGWGNDRLFPYRNGEGDDAKYGYVWITEWDTREDAREFHDTYLRMLEAHDVERTDDGYLVVPDGPFEDAFLVQLNDTRVTIVNGPTVDDVQDIRPGLAPQSATTTPASTVTAASADTTESSSDTDADATTDASDDTDDTTETSAPGFGVAIAVAAVAALGLLARRRR